MSSYPANRARIEYAAGDLMDAQAAATARFHRILERTRALIEKIEFPLGSPSRFYDLTEITNMMSDWQEPRSEALLEAEAMERADQAESHALAGRNDNRRDLRAA